MSDRHVVLSLLVALSMITYLDRVCIAIAGPRMQEELGISPEHWGWVLGAFVFAYGVFEIPSGALGDRIGQRKVLTRIVVWWSVFTSLTGTVSSYLALLAVRLLFGAGEAGAYPNMSGSIARWFPPTEQARAQGAVWAASRAGGVLAPWLVVPIMASLGWRAAFWIFCALGLIWAAIWSAWYRDDPGPASNGHTSVGAGVPWGRLCRAPQLWLLMAMYWCYVWGSMFYLTWFPTYLMYGRGLSEQEVGIYAASPFVLGVLGNLAGGHLSDRMARRYGLGPGRRLVGTVSLTIAAALILVSALTPGKAASIVFLSLGFGAMDCMLPSAWAICLELGNEHSGAVTGAMNSAGQAGGLACSVLFGYLVRASGSYDTPLFVIAAMVLASALLFAWIDPTRPLIPAEPGGLMAGEPACA
ncbi:MAG TPA: MFS transporter [Isosphaeraceae bacterium]|nr:MFS transporter [Isosphaeraceae bacterium]